MHYESTTPREDGFFMPAEFSEHHGCILIWPERPGSWNHGASAARKAFREVIRAVSVCEQVYVAVNARSQASARQMLAGMENVTIFDSESDDAWARDIAPTFLVNRSGSVRGVNWSFNAWGGAVDGLYTHWQRDDAFAGTFMNRFGYRGYNVAPFIMEGGAMHCDGEGTLMVTEACLLSAGRNASLTRDEIAQTLCAYLGAEKILWLPHGICNDETNEHIDNVCAFIRPGEVILAWTDDPNDPQYAYSSACLSYLESERDAHGRKLIVHKLPIPAVPICITKDDLQGFSFAAGEDVRTVGERLAASYVNFYFANGAIILPAFGGQNAASDARAVRILERVCPDHRVISVDARDILTGGGNIHCITQQIPKGERT